MPDQRPKEHREDNKLYRISPEQVRDVLQHLDVIKSARPDNLHPSPERTD